MRLVIELGETTTAVDYRQTLEERIIEAAAEQLLGDFDSDLRQTVRNLVEHEAQKRIADEVQAAVEEAVRGVRLNGYIAGHSFSAATLQEVAIEVCQKELRWRDGHYDSERSTLTRVIRKEVDSALEKELREALKAAKAQTVQAVREKAAEVLAKTLAPEVPF